jgi:hypothetical protein
LASDLVTYSDLVPAVAGGEEFVCGRVRLPR